MEAIRRVGVGGDPANALPVHVKVHADGAGVAHNVIVNFQQLTDTPPWRTLCTAVVPFVRAPSERDVLLNCPPDTDTDGTQAFGLEVSFSNMFNERISLSHGARFRRGRAGSEIILEITDPPTYHWPWGVLADASPPATQDGDLQATV